MKRLVGMLGLCARAGKVISGESVCDRAIKKREVFLVLLDEGASQNSQKAIGDACAFYGAELLTLPGGVLGDAIGKPGRMVAAITDRALATRLKDIHIDWKNRGGACSE